MERVGKLRASLLVAIAVAAGLTATLLLVTRSSNASGGSSLVKTARNATLRRTILVTRRGLTRSSLHAQGLDALRAQRRAARALHLHDRGLPIGLEAPGGRPRRRADRDQGHDGGR